MANRTIVSGQSGRRKNLETFKPTTRGHIQSRNNTQILFFLSNSVTNITAMVRPFLPRWLRCRPKLTTFSSGGLWARVKPSRILPKYELSLHFPVNMTTTVQKPIPVSSFLDPSNTPLFWLYCCGAVQPYNPSPGSSPPMTVSYLDMESLW